MEIKPTYKEISNYLRNDLEITREYIAEVLEKSIANTVKQLLTQKMENTPIDVLLRDAIQALATDTASDWRSASTKEKFEKAVYAQVKKEVGKVLGKEFEIEISIKPKA